MEHIGEIAQYTLPFLVLGHSITFNPVLLLMTWVVISILTISAILVTRNLQKKPTKMQSVFELLYQGFEDLVTATLGEKHAKKYFPYITTLFIFILISNFLGILPPIFKFIYILVAQLDKGNMQAAGFHLDTLIIPAFVIYIWLITGIVYMFNLIKTKKLPSFKGTGYAIGTLLGLVLLLIFNFPVLLPIPDFLYSWLSFVPAFEEPTKFLSTPLGLGLLSAIVVHYSAIKVKGLKGYFGGYNEPLPDKGIWLFLFWINPFFYLNVIGELAKVVSHSFRLFGNILGGSIIILIVSSLLQFIALPVFLQAFFGLFAGGIQAFVFSMLAVTYIAVMIK